MFAYDLLQNTSNFEGNVSIKFNFKYDLNLMEYSRYSLGIHNSKISPNATEKTHFKNLR